MLDEHDARTLNLLEPNSAGGDVGRDPVTMSDEEREAEIAELGRQMTCAMETATREGASYFMWRGLADGCRLAMETLIKGRSPAQVAKMEAERGLV